MNILQSYVIYWLGGQAYFCFGSKSSFFRCGNWNPPKERSGLGGAAAGKGVDFKETKISLVLLVLLEQAKSTVCN
ncbi:MAG: hypothetical protein AAF934_02060 [Bacteroidota bacterium]